MDVEPQIRKTNQFVSSKFLSQKKPSVLSGMILAQQLIYFVFEINRIPAGCGLGTGITEVSSSRRTCF